MLIPSIDNVRAPFERVTTPDDAVEVDASKFQTVFPYFNTPNSGNPG